MICNVLPQQIVYKHLSPQALEALKTLDQIRRSKSNFSVVRKISYQQPLQIMNARSASMFQQPQLIDQGPATFQKQPTEQSAKSKTITDRVASFNEPTPFFRDTINSTERMKENQSTLSQYLQRHQVHHQKTTASTQTDRLHELAQIKQLQDVQMDTIISQFASPGKLTPNSISAHITPIVNSAIITPTNNGQKLQNHLRLINLSNISSIQGNPAKGKSPNPNNTSYSADLKRQLMMTNNSVEELRKSDRTPTIPSIPRNQDEKENCFVDLLQKKQRILKQILSLDNQIKIMQDEETKSALSPIKPKDDLYKRGIAYQQQQQKMYSMALQQKQIQELEQCTFAPKTNKRSSNPIPNQYKKKSNVSARVEHLESSKKSISPTIKNSGVYQRNQEWLMRINMKKQKFKSQRDINVSEKSRSNSRVPKQDTLHKKANSQQLCNVEFTRLIQRTNTPKNKDLHAHTQACSPRIKNSIQQVDQKYQQLLAIASKIRARK